MHSTQIVHILTRLARYIRVVTTTNQLMIIYSELTHRYDAIVLLPNEEHSQSAGADPVTYSPTHSPVN